MRVELVKTFQFEAAHANAAGDAPQKRVHGHSYRVSLHVEGDCDPNLGWLIDYAELAAWFDPLYRQLDHFLLNDVDGLSDVSTEGLSDWIFARLKPQLAILAGVEVEIVGDCAFTPRESITLNRATSSFTFEAAHALPNLPESHKCRRLHGHSFRVEAIAPDLDELRGPLKAIYRELDHRNLNEITGLKNPTSENVAKWIWDSLAGAVRGLESVTVAETCTARCVYRGE